MSSDGDYGHKTMRLAQNVFEYLFLKKSEI